MATDRINLSVVKGSSATWRLTATDSVGASLNLSGFSIRSYIKYKFSDSGILLNLNPVIYHAASGIIDLTISGTASSNLVCGTFPFDCEVWQTGVGVDYVSKFVRGFLQVDPEASWS